tara:strand:+ start:52797 stop:53126 length:330 start_codon:yes stop_codon:yes gene_type:complete
MNSGGNGNRPLAVTVAVIIWLVAATGIGLAVLLFGSLAVARVIVALLQREVSLLSFVGMACLYIFTILAPVLAWIAFFRNRYGLASSLASWPIVVIAVVVVVIYRSGLN